ncbi:MAG: tagaturonate epimerase family protein, partial [Bryobacteraceae bacterium]
AGIARSMSFSSVRPYFGSLQHDPVHSSCYYLAVDAIGGARHAPLLLRLAPASAPSSGLFPNAILIGRMRPGGGREVVVNAAPFSSHDSEAVRTFAGQVDPEFLPRPQGALPAIATGNRHPEVSLPAAFEAFRRILADTGVNLASTVQLSATREMTTDEALAARDGENPTSAGHTRVSIRHLYDAGLWAAIRAGWRSGYTAEADHIIISGETDDAIARSIEAGQEAIRHAAGYTKFTTDTSRLFDLRADPRHPQAWDESVRRERFEALFSPEDRSWIRGQFGRPFEIGGAVYRFEEDDIVRLAVKFGRSLQLNEKLHESILTVKAAGRFGRGFDFEPSIDEADTLTTPEEMIFYMHWLKARGRPAQLAPPNLGFKKRQAYPETMEALHAYVQHKMWPELERRVASEFAGRPLAELAARVASLAEVARYFNGTLSIHSGSGKQAAVLEEIGRATGGRVNYKISGELQLQLFDVLREQPEDSPWRALYERMAARCNRFAEAAAFGGESALARQYAATNLGDPARGRVDGNLFLVFWLGNMVGSRDADGRFFKEQLDELPEDLVEEVRRRNTEYIVWLARHLRG